MGLGRAPCCEKVGLNRGAWTPEEDMRLIAYVEKHGHDNWRALPKQAGLLRCGKSCRLRWINYLRPDLRRGNFSKEEEDTIIKLHELLGNKWSKIASCLPGRTDNEIKNVWNTHLKKRLKLEEQSLSTPTPINDGTTKRSVLPSSPSSTTTSIYDEFKCDGHKCQERTAGAEVFGLDNLNIPILPSLDSWDMLDSSIQSPPLHPLPSAETSAWSDNIMSDSIDEILGSDIDLEIWNDVVTSTVSTKNWAEEKQWWLAYLEEELGLLDDNMA